MNKKQLKTHMSNKLIEYIEFNNVLKNKYE